MRVFGAFCVGEDAQGAIQLVIDRKVVSLDDCSQFSDAAGGGFVDTFGQLGRGAALWVGDPIQQVTAVAATGAIAEAARFEQDNTFFWITAAEMVCGRSASKTTADDGQVRARFAAQGWQRLVIRCSFDPDGAILVGL